MPIPSVDTLESDLEDLREAASPDAVSYVNEAIEAIASPRRPGLAGAEEGEVVSPEDVAQLIDHTQLRPAATDDQIEQLCAEAERYGFGAACVHPVHVPRVARRLENTSVTPCTVVGFPHGANRTATKAWEAERAVMDGARELDMVQAIGAVTSGRYSDAEADVRAVVTAAREGEQEIDSSVPVKVILETAVLSPAQIAVASVIARRAGADFVKTSTGFASTGARAGYVALMRQVVGEGTGR